MWIIYEVIVFFTLFDHIYDCNIGGSFWMCRCFYEVCTQVEQQQEANDQDLKEDREGVN